MGSRPAATRAALVRENGLEPKKPLWADSGDGWADSMIVWRDVSIERLLAAGVAAPQDEHDRVVLGVDGRITSSVNVSQPWPWCDAA